MSKNDNSYYINVDGHIKETFVANLANMKDSEQEKTMLVYSLGDTKLPSGTQLFVPETVAKYFTRDVVDIDLIHVDDLAEIEQRDDALRAEIVVKNETEGQVFAKDAEIAFEGYADDLGEPISGCTGTSVSRREWRAAIS